MKRWMSVCLSLSLLLLAATALADVADHTAYSQFPLVQEGGQVTVRVAIPRDESYGRDAKDMWFWQWSEAATGVAFEVEQILTGALRERKNLMFAADDLPDLLLGMVLSTQEIVRYGVTEHQLLALDAFLTPDIMPHMTGWFAAYPDLNAICIAPDGSVYTLPAIVNAKNTVGNNEKIFIKQTWLDEMGLKTPDTLEEFTAMLHAFKEAYPDSVPLGGGGLEGTYNPISYLLNAFGFITKESNDYGQEVAIREGQAVIPAYDPVFLDVLTLLHQYYADGLLAQDFFTMDNTAVNALMSEDKVGVYPFAPYWATPAYEDFSRWVSVRPLTSDWNDTKQYLAPNAYNIGGVALSAKTKVAEYALRYIDFFYSDLGGNYLWEGPIQGSADTLGIVSGVTLVFDEGTQSYNTYYTDVRDLKTFESNLAYVHGMSAGLSGSFGNRSHSIEHPELTHRFELMQYLMGTPLDQIVPLRRSPEVGDGNFRLSMMENIQPFEVSGYPAFVYYDAATEETINEISTLLEPHIKSEVAKFVTGVRPLGEFDKFLEELKAFGVEDLQRIYQDVWAEYQSLL